MNTGKESGRTGTLTRYNLLSRFKNLAHFTTTRQTFTDPSPRFTGIIGERITENLAQLSQATGIECFRFVFPRQVHSDFVRVVDSQVGNNLAGTDALVSDKRGICLCVQTADCVPVFIYSPDKKAIAIVHAGWKGTVGLIVQKTVRLLEEAFFCDPSGMIAVIGPSIGPEVYEVGEEVIGQVIQNIPAPEEVLKITPGGKALLNLWKANQILLVDAGLSPGNIEISGLCTYSSPGRYFSARFDGRQTGRMVSGIMIL